MPLTLRKWNLSIGGGQPLFCILGLNVLEDTGLALETARHLKQVTAELDLPFVFKASFDKANRSSFKSYRGPGLEQGLAMLAKVRSEEHTSELQSLMRISYAVFCLKKKKHTSTTAVHESKLIRKHQ